MKGIFRMSSEGQDFKIECLQLTDTSDAKWVGFLECFDISMSAF